MSDIRPIQKLAINGKEYELKFTHRAFSVAQHLLAKQGWNIQLLGPRAQEFWKGLNDVESVIIEGKAVDTFAPDHFSLGVLLYVGLIHQNRTMALEDALDLITFENFWDITPDLYRAAVESMTGLSLEEAAKREQQEEPTDETPLAAGNGGASGGPLPETTSDSTPDPSPETATTSSGTSPLPNSTPSGSDG